MGLIADYITDGALIAFPFDEAHTAGNDTFTADNDGVHSASFTETSNIASLGTGFDCSDCEAISITAQLSGTTDIGSVAQDTPYSIVFFFQHDSGTASWIDALNQGYGVQFQYDTTEEELRVVVWWDGNEQYLFTGDGSVQSGEQYCVALTVDPDNGVCKLYLDGTLVDSDDQGSAQTFDWSNTLALGAAWSSPSYTFQALGIFDSVLSASKVSEYANATQNLNKPIIPIHWILPTANPFIQLEWMGTAQPSISIEWALKTGQPVIPLHWITVNTGQPVIGLAWSFTDVSSYPAASEAWSLDFLIDGVSYASRFTGECTVNPEEDSSRLANFSIVHSTGPVNEMSYIGKQVIINVTTGSGSVRLFKGVVSNAVFDMDIGVIDFSCTDDLQGLFENADREYIEGVIGGKYSKHIFNEKGDGWSYAQDRLSTQYKSLHLDVNRTPVLTDLTAKDTPDFTFTDATRYDTPITLSRATRRDLLNRVRLNYAYRFTRLRQRVINYTLNQVNAVTGNSLTFCNFLANPYTRPTKDKLDSAISGSGWSVINKVHVDPLPETGFYRCYLEGWSLVGWILNDAYKETDFFTARWQLSKRFAQSVTEQYTFDIRAGDSIEYVGEVGIEQNFALENDYDASKWESEPFNEVDDTLTRESTGDYVKDMVSGSTGRSASDIAQETALAQAVNDVKKSHRQNSVTFDVPFHPSIDLTHTVQLSSEYITAKGKVRELTHTFNADTGEATTTISIALSKHGGSGLVTDTALDAVTPPEIEQVPYDTSQRLEYYVGGEQNSIAFDESLYGFFTNRQAYSGDYPRYDVGFRLKTPEIADAHRSTTEVISSNTINVEIPDDLLTLSA